MSKTIKKQKENKKEIIFKKDLSLNALLTSHLSEFRTDLTPSSIIYNGASKSHRWSGDFSKSKVFTLRHYNTPILKVNIASKATELVKLPSDRVRGNTNGDLRGINTALRVMGITLQAIKRQGITRLLHYSINGQAVK